MTIVGAAALAVVSGWLFATALPPRPSPWSLAAISAGIVAVTAETVLIVGMAAGLVALGGIVGGGIGQRAWLGAIRTWAASP